MHKEFLMGNAAIALGAVAAGVNVVAGYPGTPSTEVLETVAKNRPDDVYVEWSVNEKAAMELAAGAAYAGARSMVTMKQVGLNVASDPLMSLEYVGIKGGMVILVADDPGPISSQTEQDTRHFSRFSKLPCFDPSSAQEAYEMIGKTPSHIQAIRPLSKGVVCNYKMTEEMVKHFIKKICKDSLIKPRIAMCVPSGITNVESNAVIDVAIASGARKVYLIEEPVAAAIGAQIDIEKPNGNLIVDIGGGTTDIAVLSLNGIVNKKSIKIAGDTINDAIVRYVRNSHGVLIGEKMADQIKRQVASVCWEEGEDISAPVKGRNLTTGLPCNIEISRSMLYDCVIKEVEQIITAVKEVIERTPPELVGDIHTNGITLTGGGSLLHGIAPLLEKHTRIHTVIAEDPVNCVAIGTGKSFQYLDKLVDGFVIPSMQRV